MTTTRSTPAAATHHHPHIMGTESTQDLVLHHRRATEQDHGLAAAADSVATTSCQIYQYRCGHLKLNMRTLHMHRKAGQMTCVNFM